MWVDYKYIRKFHMPFNFIIGGRGGGKTYGAVQTIFEERLQSIFMRRTGNEIDLILSGKDNANINPFMQYSIDKNLNISVGKINKNLAVFGTGDFKEYEDANGTVHNEPFIEYGMLLALSTLANIRGFSAERYTDLFFDEFIPEKHVKRMKSEDEAFLNAYETICRNREFSGRPPLNAYLLSNSNSLASPLLSYLHLDDKINKMKRKSQNLYLDGERGILIYLPKDQEFIEKKKQTAIARLTQDTDFYKMAIENDFAYDDFTCIESRTIRGSKCVAVYDGIGIWFNNQSKNVYCCLACGNECEHYTANDADKRRFRMKVGKHLFQKYLENSVYFQSFHIKQKIVDAIK